MPRVNRERLAGAMSNAALRSVPLPPRYFAPQDRFRVLPRDHAERLVTLSYDPKDVKGTIWMIRYNDDRSIEVIAAFMDEREAWSTLQQLVLDAAERERSVGWGG